MVQIFDAPDTFASLLSKNVAPQIGSIYEAFLEPGKRKEETEKYKELGLGGLEKIRDPNMRKVIAEKLLAQAAEQGEFEKIFPSQTTQQPTEEPTPPSPYQEPTPKTAGREWKDFSPQQKSYLEQRKPKLAQSLKEQDESQLLAKHRSGQELTPEEQARLSPQTQRSLLQSDIPQFERESEKLEAKRVSELATQIENDYEGAKSENLRLNQMERLSKKGDLSSPLMVKTLQMLNLPLGVLGNPDTEEYQKLESEFLRDVRNIFPGGRITNYEIQSYLKGIPSLMNTTEGRKAIIANRRLLNKAKELKFDAYKQILKENKGKKPENLGLLINERTGEQLSSIENEYRDSLANEAEKFQQPIKMIGPDGKSYNIPPDKIESALKDQFRFP